MDDLEGLKSKIFLVIILGLLIIPNLVFAVPQGTIFYKTGRQGKMYGYNNFEFSLIPGKAHFGNVAIYLGKDRITNKDMILALTSQGIKKIPAKYFVDLDKGEKFLGAKVLKGFDKTLWDINSNMWKQRNEEFDITYHKQKGPQSGDWTSVGFVEKVFESANSKQLAYHSRQTNKPNLHYYYSKLDITPDGYDNKTVINKKGDVFSKTKEFSKIHTLTLNKELKDILNGKAKKVVDSCQNIAKEIYGKTFNNERYFFFPYTQFLQPTLKKVNIGDMVVSSKDIPKEFQSPSNSQKLLEVVNAFSERAILVYGKEGIKKLLVNSIGLKSDVKKIAKVYKKTKKKLKQIEVLADESDVVGIKDLNKQKRILERKAQASLRTLSQKKESFDSAINESLEFMDLVEKGYIGDKESKEDKEREIELQINRLAENNEGNAVEEVEERQLGETTEINDLKDQLEKEVKKIEKSQSENDKKGKKKEKTKKEKNIFKEESKKLNKNKDNIKEEKKKDNESKNGKQEDEGGVDEKSFKKSDIVINEFLPAPNSNQEEWVELYNNTDSKIDLNNWTIEDNTKDKENLTGQIDSNDFLVLNQSQDFNFSLNNNGDKIILKFKDKVIDSVTYDDFDDGNIGDNAPSVDKGNSLARKKDGKIDLKKIWQETISLTPGEPNKIEINNNSVTWGGGSANTSSDNQGDDSQGSDGTINYQSYSELDIVISEIAWMGTSASAYDEWIELYNNTDSKIDLSGWKIVINDESFKIDLEGKIPANDFLLLERTDNTTISNIEANKTFTGGLSNDGEQMKLIDGNGNIIDSINFKTGWVEGRNSDKSSMERLNFKQKSTPNNWQTCHLDSPFAKDKDSNFIQGTPKDFSSNKGFKIQSKKDDNDQGDEGKNNEENNNEGNENNEEGDNKEGSDEEKGDSKVDKDKGEVQFNKGDIIINEISPKPLEGGVEKIELYNHTTSTINLIDWTIEDNTKDKENLTGQIDSNDFLVLNQSQDFNFSLNNNGDKIILKFKDKVIDSVTYDDFDDGNIGDNAPSVDKGNSLARKDYIDTDIDKNDFYITITPTFGSENTITLPDKDSPEITIFEKPDKVTNKTSAVFKFNSNEKVNYFCRIDEKLEERCVSGKEYINLLDGKHEFFIKAADQAQNVTKKSYTWTIDTVKPISFIDNEIGKTNNLPDSISGSISGDDVIKVEVQLQKGQNSKFLKKQNNKFIWIEDNLELWVKANFNPSDKTWIFNLPKPIMGEDFYYIRSRAIDKNGNVSEVSEKEFIFDKNPPAKIKDVQLKTKNNLSKIEITWPEPSDNLSGVDYYNLSYNGHTTTTPANIFTIDIKNKTNYKIKVKALDKAGNSGIWSNEKQKLISTSESIIINEVQVGEKEFIELYNPTRKQIDLDGWYFAYYSSSQKWDGSTQNNPNKDKPYRLKKFPDDAKIQPEEYYLIGVYNFSKEGVDWQIKTKSDQPYSRGQLSNSSGSVVIYNFNPEGKNAEFLRKNAIDTLGWGDSNVFEAMPVKGKSLKGNSLERKDKNDTSNNKIDFAINSNPTPQNSVGKWIVGWEKRDALLIKNNKNRNSLSDYQVKIKINYKEGMKRDFSDIRFTDSSGLNTLNYFRETYKDFEYAIFWVKIKHVPEFSEVKIYKYYKNNQADYVGSGKDVFLWFDDFDSNTSNEYIRQDAKWDIDKGVVTLGANWQSNSNRGFISPKGISLKNVYIKTKIYLKDNGNHRRANKGFITYRQKHQNEFWMYGIVNGRKYIYDGLTLTKKINGSLNFIKQDNKLAGQYNKWFNLEVSVFNTKHRLNFSPVNDDFGNKKTWVHYSHYNNDKGQIYFKGEDVDNHTGVKLDYIMIGKNTQPNLQVVKINNNYKVEESVPEMEYPNFPGWQNKDIMTIKNTGYTSSTNVVVKIDVNYKEGMSKDFSDIRFVNPKTNKEYTYWNESYIKGKSAVFWIKIPEMFLKENRDIDLYYNNPSATYIGNPVEVFSWYEDFETNRIKKDINIVTQEIDLLNKQGIVELKSNGKIFNTNLDLKDIIIKTRFKTPHSNGDRWMYGGDGANIGMVDYRIQDSRNFWSFGINNNGFDGKYGPNIEVTENNNPFIRWLPPGRKIYSKWVNFVAKIRNNNHNISYTIEKDNPSNEIIRSMVVEDVGINKPGMLGVRAEDIEFRGAHFDYILVAPYNPDIKVMY